MKNDTPMGHRQLPGAQRRAEQGVEIVHKEAVVFEEAQQQKIHEHGRDEHEPPAPAARFLKRQLTACKIVERDVQHHEDEVFRRPPGEEHEAAHDEGGVFQPLRQHKIQDEADGQEYEREDKCY